MKGCRHSWCQWLIDTRAMRAIGKETSVKSHSNSIMLNNLQQTEPQCLSSTCARAGTDNLFMFSALLDVFVWFFIDFSAHATEYIENEYYILHCRCKCECSFFFIKSNVNLVRLWPFTDPFNELNLYAFNRYSYISDCMLIELKWIFNTTQHWPLTPNMNTAPQCGVSKELYSRA